MRAFRGFLLRTPLLPFDELEQLGAGSALTRLPSSASDAELEAHLEDDRRRLRTHLCELVRRPVIREALRLASPSLEAELDAWTSDQPRDDRTHRRIELTLLRYLARMTARPTPFGLLAGCSWGAIGTPARIVLLAAENAVRRTRMSFEHAHERAQQTLRELAHAPDGQDFDRLIVRPGSTLYRAGGQLRCLATRTVLLEPSPALELTLARCRTGAAVGDLVEALLASDVRVDREEARRFAGELLESGVLESELEPPLTGDAVFLDRQLPAAHAVVDLYKPSEEVSLGPAVIDELARGVALLHRFFPRREDRLAEFRRTFVERYGARRVPLGEVLDEDCGLHLPPARVSQEVWRPEHAALLALLERTFRSGATTLSLSTGDLPEPDPRALPLPGSLTVVASIAARSAEACEAGDFRVWIHSAGGPSGANLLARFCHLDPRIRELVAEVIAADEAGRPGVIHAELVHLPDPKAGNVLARPLLREYELPYLGRSGAPPARQLHAGDLELCVEDDRLVLRSIALNREILPRLSNAHDYDHGPPVYRLLCMLQHQGVIGGLRFSWGPLAVLSRLPRVTSGRLVLSRARWRLSADQLKVLAQARGARLFREIRALSDQLALPRWVEMVDRDRMLVVDLHHLPSIEAWVNTAKDREYAELLELFPPPDELLAEGPEGRYVSELIVPFSVEGTNVPARPPPPRTRGRRLFPPGSEWLYAKLYCGPAVSDRVLRELVRPVLTEARARDAVSSWFFVRFADPRPHLRLRLRGEPARLTSEVLPLLTKLVEPALRTGRVDSMVLDTYERELERYGGDEGIQRAELFFAADSEAALQAVEQLSTSVRRSAALLAADVFLTDDLQLDLAARVQLCSVLRGGVQPESSWRAERPELERWLARSPAAQGDTDDAFTRVRAILRTRSEHIAPLFAPRDSEPAPELLHLMVNRWLRAPTPQVERLFFDTLARWYRSQLARQSAPSPPGTR